ncbi:MAG TPA: peptidylprolyl isomerase [Methylomirabilota bacterium]|nr:peptidylprolyl isomerase [Methylomirabilota bacterium]
MTRRPGLAVLLITLVLAAGCSIPSWVPLIGKDKPKPGATPVAKAEPAPVPPAAPPLLGTKHESVLPTDGVLDRVICVVNNDAITLYELEEAEAQYLYESKEAPPDGEALKALRDKLLNLMIENRIQLQQAEKEKIVIEDGEMNDNLSEVMKKVNAKNQKEFEDILKANGLTLEGVKKRLKEQLMVERVRRRKVNLRISVTEAEIDRYLAENRQKLETGLSFEARHILFLPDPSKGEDGWAEVRKRADHIYALLLEGRDFSELAKEHSDDASGKDGGHLGKVKRGELAPDIEEAILRLQVGESSAPFRSQVGYHLFHLDAKETMAGEALVQARNQIRDILYRQKYDARLTEWLSEIKQRAIIDIRM